MDARNGGATNEIRAAVLRIGHVGKQMPTCSGSFAIDEMENRIVTGGTVSGGEALGVGQHRFKFGVDHHWFDSQESRRRGLSRDGAEDGREDSMKM